MAEEKKMTRLEKGRLEYQRKVRAGEIKRLSPAQKAKENPKSMRLAINSNCYDCNARENWIVRTKYCVMFDCSFWNLRKGGKNITKEMCLAHEVN